MRELRTRSIAQFAKEGTLTLDQCAANLKQIDKFLKRHVPEYDRTRVDALAARKWDYIREIRSLLPSVDAYVHSFDDEAERRRLAELSSWSN